MTNANAPTAPNADNLKRIATIAASNQERHVATLRARRDALLAELSRIETQITAEERDLQHATEYVASLD